MSQDQQGSNQERAGRPTTETESPTGGSLAPLWWLGLGLFLFGFVQGFTTGGSVAEGVSNTLLTSLGTFVGGVLLTYAGFRKVTQKLGVTARLDTRRVGIGLCAFSIGVFLGLCSGVAARTYWVEDLDHDPRGNSSAKTGKPAQPDCTEAVLATVVAMKTAPHQKARKHKRPKAKPPKLPGDLHECINKVTSDINQRLRTCIAQHPKKPAP